MPSDTPQEILDTRVIAGEPATRLARALDREDAAYQPGDVLPAAWHWLTFLNTVRASQLSADGRGGADGLLPPFEGRSRMWAGCELRFFAPLLIADAVERCSHVSALKEKSGRSGALVVASIAHRLQSSGRVCVEERTDLVFRPLVRFEEPDTGPRADVAAQWRVEICPDEVLLFSFSALTHNAHRIHYDWPYATGVEGYPGLVVHGPLTAILLLELVRLVRPEDRIASFSCRAVRPLFCGRSMALCARASSSGGLDLWAEDTGGFIAMRATARFADLSAAE